MPDYYSKHGAGLLADAVTAYWVRQGHGNVLAERYAMGSTGAWGVRSNLVNGRPPPRVEKRGRHTNGKVVLVPRSEPEVAAARREFLR